MIQEIKTFTLAGTSTVAGVCTFRVANGKASSRVGILRRAGHTGINITELPEPMSRADAVSFLRSQGVEGIVPVKSRVAKTAAQLAAARAQADAEKAAVLRDRKNQRRREQRAAAKVIRTTDVNTTEV